MKYNYQKAIKSLQKYPLPLYSGQDCHVLANFGDKICKLIDQKIERHVKELGPINWEDYIKVKDLRVASKAVKKKKIGPKRSEQTKGNHTILRKSLPANKEIGRGGRQYIPTYRSGAYALLVALGKAAQASDYRGFSWKQELIEGAQELCDSSFTHPVEGSHYTAWSSMATLIKKDLVRRSNNPGRYTLTADGVSLARLLASTTSLPTPSPSVASSAEGRRAPWGSESPDPVCHDISSSSDNDDDRGSDSRTSASHRYALEETSPPVGHAPKRNESIESRAARASPALRDRDGGVFFTYVTADGLETPWKNKSVISVDEEKGFPLFLIKAKLIHLLSSDLDYQLEDERVAPPGFTYALLSDASAPEVIPGAAAEPPPSASGKTCRRQHEVRDTKVSDSEKRTFALPYGLGEEEPKTSVFDRQKLSHAGKTKEKRKRKSEETVGSSRDEGTLSLAPKSPKHSVVEEDIVFTLKPGTFKVFLSIDNTEVFGGSCGGKKSTKEIIRGELEKHEVDFQVRKLNVGDFLWTCRGRDTNGEESELALPFVVERKRMDDLSQSVRDGRFREQKFRLKQSGLSRPIYLVEAVGSAHATLPLASCEQAVANTQVVDGFAVKLTKDQKETAAYLTIMTQYLHNKFKNKTLHCVARNSPWLSKADLCSPDAYLMSFKEVNSFSAKNRPLCLQEMLAKHLLQMHGASVDKVTAITQKYRSPRALVQALEARPPSSRDGMLCELKCPKSGRFVDLTVSSQIAKLYTLETLL